jgi:YVTN family beta-propeller protein
MTSVNALAFANRVIYFNSMGVGDRARLTPDLACFSAASVQGAQQGDGTQKIVREGIAIEFSARPSERVKELEEGVEASVRFRITDNTTGRPVGNLHPAAWIDRKTIDFGPDDRRCREKIQSFLQASFGHRPDIDLNTYLLLSLNNEPNISVIDPLSGFGGSKLYTLIELKSPGEDWVMSRDQHRLFVTTPLAGQVAVIDTSEWKVVANIAAGPRPGRIVLQPDEKYLWVASDDLNEKVGGLSVIDASTLKVVTRFNTGFGVHEIGLSDDNHYAFVTNKQSGTLSIIDVRKLTKIKDLKVGSLPTGVAFSPLSKAVYVINEGDGDVVVIDAQRNEIVTRIKAEPGLHAIRLAPGGRFGFVVNRRTNVVNVFDSATNELLHTIPVGKAPDQVSFTRNYAYVRSRGDEFVTMINLASLGKKGTETIITRFPAGQRPPQMSPSESIADAVVAAPEDGSVLVANPADKMIYYYMEGMAAPMGTFQNYGRDPKALLVLDRSLREKSPGVYEATVKLNGHGRYDVAFLLDSPRVVNCFTVTINENPELTKRREVPISIQPLPSESIAYVGESYVLRFKVFDVNTNRPRADLKDIGVLTFLSPGIWQQRQWASASSEGVYEIKFVPPQAGVYYVFFECPSLTIQFNQLPRLSLPAKDRAGP